MMFYLLFLIFIFFYDAFGVTYSDGTAGSLTQQIELPCEDSSLRHAVFLISTFCKK
jgi:hypothetical protein